MNATTPDHDRPTGEDPRRQGAEAHKPLIACRFDPTGRFVFAGVRGQHGPALGPGGRPAKAKPVAFAGARQLGLRPGRLARRQDPPHRRQRRQADLVAGRGREARSRSRTVDAHQRLGPRDGRQPRRRAVATCGNDRKVRLWSLADGSPCSTCPATTKPVYRVAYTADGKHLVSADLKGLVIQWD